jgi:hypothetical protein
MSPTITEPSSTASLAPANAAAARKPAGAETHAPEGFLVWLPALCILVGLPLLAFATTKYFVIPSLRERFAQQAAAMGQGQPAPLYLERIQISPVNPAQPYIGLRGFAMVGEDANFKATIEQNRAKLTQLGDRFLSGVTVADLEKPGALVAMRARILVACNQLLGEPIVKEVYISEWPVSLAAR